MNLNTDLPLTDSFPLLPLGKDEMNFAEYPITLLTDRVPKGQTCIEYEDQIYDEKRKRMITRRRVIQASEKYGLPTATDNLVILALIQMTKQRCDFRRRDVEFSRLELLNLLDWPDEGGNYKRIKESLLRIKSVSYIYDNAWWDNRQKTWTTRAFSILDNVEINDSRTADRQGTLFPSRITWNEVVFDSFQAGFIRDIDFQLCKQFQHPTALTMYRFLGKRFYLQPEWIFELKDFAHKHVGLGQNYEGGTQLARKLKPAIQELETVGFLEPLSEQERFTKKGRQWSVRFVQKAPAPPPLASTLPEKAKEATPSLIAELVARGVTKTTAAELVQAHPAALIERQIDYLDWLNERTPNKIAQPGGYLVQAIAKDYAAPKGFVSKADRQKAEAEKKAKEQRADEDRRRQQKETAADREYVLLVEAHLKTLTNGELGELEAKALAAATPETRETYHKPFMAQFRNKLMKDMVRDYLRPMLQGKLAAKA